MQRLICASAALTEGGDGWRFDLDAQGTPAFVVRFGGVVYAWQNRCAHISVELDWNPGKFFDDSGLYLICATHGALYAPDTGRCISGPCRNGGLLPVAIEERDGNIYLETHERSE